jgi:hypothetical protein
LSFSKFNLDNSSNQLLSSSPADDVGNAQGLRILSCPASIFDHTLLPIPSSSLIYSFFKAEIPFSGTLIFKDKEVE